MRYEFHPDALAEYEEAAQYYAGCREGLEFRFIAAVEHAASSRLSKHRNAGISWRKTFVGVLRGYSRMPYSIPSKRTMSSLLRLCIAIVNQATGGEEFPS